MEDDHAMGAVKDDSESDQSHVNVSDITSQLMQHVNVSDITSRQAREGKDIQGIPWDKLHITREKYRQTRLEQYKNYENIPNYGEASEKECQPTEKGGMFYEFEHNTCSVKPTIFHFQLRNLVWATSKHDVYFISHYSVMHWSALTSKAFEVMNVSGHVAPSEKHPGSLLEGFTKPLISTLAVKDKFIVAGGFQGELICKDIDWEGISYCCRTTHDDNAITNAIEFYDSDSGSVHFFASNNDGGVRDFDMEKFQFSNHFEFGWPVNHTSLSPDRKLLVVVGDNPEGLLVDAHSGETVQKLHGHKDYSFASAWHPDGSIFATGNQDKTCRLWDVRNLSKSLSVFRGNIGAIRSVRFSSDGKFMAMAEPADFVHIFDVGSGYTKRQELDFFGEIAGVAFSPDTESLFVGVCDRTYHGLLHYSRSQT